MVSENADDEDENVIYLGDDKPIVLNKINANVKPKKEKSTKEKHEPKEKSENKKAEAFTAPVIKRGQKSKMKKMKEKYKDCDEDDKIAFIALMKVSSNYDINLYSIFKIVHI